MSDLPKPSATVVVLRNPGRSLELLLLRRASSEPEKPGVWVFPGGKVEDSDRALAPDDSERQARYAATRETREEAGLELATDRLLPISRWITPKMSPKRFDTWFFLSAIADEANVQVDGTEIDDHRWMTPAAAIAAYRAQELRLAPPTYVTIHWLLEHASVEAAMGALSKQELITFHPRIIPHDQGACILYPGDAGYDDRNPDAAGARHRLWSRADGWHYERD